ncbi:MAG: oxidoreductase [Paludibacteraceae bacterium]|nr:oxidoreductase [Paludibacteraceae bacterium]
MKQQVILITGGSSGIGYETAKSLALQGHIVYAAARRIELMEPLREVGVHPLSLDVTDEASIQAAVSTLLSEQGHIDVLINNAGYGSLGAVENVTPQEAHRQLEVNVFGLARLIQLILPTMRAQHSGRIINIASIAGKVTLANCGWYNVSKFAVEALSDALRMEVKPYGIKVVIIEPSAIKTDWGLIAADHLYDSSQGTVYETFATKEATLMRKLYTSNLLSGPDKVRKAICKAVNARRPRLRYQPGLGANLIIYSHALLPSRWWDNLNRWMINHA